MTKDEINAINKECPYDQGIFTEPYGIPVHIKEPVIYCRYKTGGYSGGNCWGSESRLFVEDVPKDRFKVLDLTLQVLFPDIKYLQYKEIEELIHDNEEREYEYYGNCTDWKCEYIILSELERLIEGWTS